MDWETNVILFCVIVFIVWCLYTMLTKALPNLFESFAQCAQEDPETAKQILETAGAVIQVFSPDLHNRISQYQQSANQKENAHLETEKLRIEVEKLRTELRERNLEVKEREDYQNRGGPDIFKED